jgi:hypothetical protein
MSPRPTTVELAVLRQIRENRCMDVWVGVWFPGVQFRLAEKEPVRRITIMFLWIQAEVRVTVMAVDCLMEVGNGMGWESDGQRFSW